MTDERDRGRARPQPGPETAPPARSVATAVPRHRVATTGRIESIHVVRIRDPIDDRPAQLRLECELDDGTGTLTLVFLGRYRLAGLDVGSRVSVEGVVNSHLGELRVINPTYRLLPDEGD